MTMPMAPIAITHIGMAALVATPPLMIASLIAARGPTALATSLAPCAKLNIAAAKISGTVNSELMLLFSLDNLLEYLRTSGTTINQDATAIATPIPRAVMRSIFQIFFNPLSAR